MIGVLNRLVNPLVRLVLRSPLHRLLSRSLMLIAYTGRRSGKRRTISVMYARTDGTLLTPGNARLDLVVTRRYPISPEPARASGRE